MNILNINGFCNVSIRDEDGLLSTYPNHAGTGPASNDIPLVEKFIKDNPKPRIVIVPMWMAWYFQRKNLDCVFLGFEKLGKPCSELGTTYKGIRRIYDVPTIELEKIPTETVE